MMKKLFLLLTLVLVTTAAPGCLPTNNFSSTTDDETSDDSSDDAEEDGALAPCTSYDTTNPTRAICVSCYASVLETSCPEASEFADCTDTSVLDTYVSQINQCISQSIIAGFTCSITCPIGQVVNSSTCTCVTASSGGSGGGGNVDVGQTNFGPPIVGLAWPTVADADASATTCAGSFPLYMSVQNRGSTVFRLNTYGPPVFTPTSGGLDLQTLPRAMTPTEMSSTPGSNVYGNVGYVTTGATGLTADYTGRAAKIETLSGADSDGVSSSGSSVAATAATWLSPSFSARDSDGNLYFSDSRAHVVKVICYNPVGGHPFCGGVTAGFIKTIAGTEGSAGNTGDNAVGTAARLNTPHGIAVDRFSNVFIADSANHVIRVVCGYTTGGICNLQTWTATFIYRVAGTLSTPGATAALLNYPYGVDISNETNPTLSIADYQNHAIRGCVIATATEVCDAAAATALTYVLGNGTSGFQADGVASTAAAWIRFPTDVKMSVNGNLVYSDYGNHLVRAICYTAADVCTGKTINVAGHVNTLAGKMSGSTSPSPGNASNGTLGTNASITRPYQLHISNTPEVVGSGSYGATYPDNNILFSERLYAPTLFNGRFTPSALIGANNATAILLGQSHSCVMTSSGAIQCLGNNTYNQMGSGSGSGGNYSAPVTVSGMSSGIGKVAVGLKHGCASDASGNNLKCWGDNSYGQLGDNTVLSRTSPVAVTDTQGSVSFISPGAQHTCVENSTDREVYCWGENSYGQLGDGTNIARNKISSAEPVDNLPQGNTTYGLVSGSNHACVLHSTGAAAYGVRCWGADNAGQLGNNATLLNQTSAQAVATLTAANAHTALAAGGDHTCVINSVTSTVHCWGSNSAGESGQVTTDSTVETPLSVTLPITPTQLALGLRHSCTMNAAGKVYCWGDNTYGQLGNDDLSLSSAPMEVPLPEAADWISAGGNSTCAHALLSGAIYCWGDNYTYQIGTSTFASATGNTIRMLCGTNAVGSEGYCDGLLTGTIYRLGGLPGVSNNGNQGEGGFGYATAFASVQGVSYDLYKNIVFTSAGFIDKSGGVHKDFSVRVIKREIVSSLLKAKFTFMDSNSQTSAYCLRVKAATQCDPQGTCTCRLAAPTDDQANPDFWTAISLNNTCQ